MPYGAGGSAQPGSARTWPRSGSRPAPASSGDAAGSGPALSPNSAECAMRAKNESGIRRECTFGEALGVLRRKLPVLEHGIDDPVILGLFGGQDLVAVGVLTDRRGVLAGVAGQGRFHQRAHPLDLGGLNLQIGELPLD